VTVQFLTWRGFIFYKLTLVSSTDVSNILLGIADGLQYGTHPVIPKYRNANFYVEKECNSSHDVICKECQMCGVGFFDNNTCGVNYGNDRLDTQCAACPAAYYCPGGSVSQLAILCADNRCAAS